MIPLLSICWKSRGRPQVSWLADFGSLLLLLRPLVDYIVQSESVSCNLNRCVRMNCYWLAPALGPWRLATERGNYGLTSMAKNWVRVTRRKLWYQACAISEERTEYRIVLWVLILAVSTDQWSEIVIFNLLLIPVIMRIFSDYQYTLIVQRRFDSTDFKERIMMATRLTLG